MGDVGNDIVNYSGIFQVGITKFFIQQKTTGIFKTGDQ